MPHSSNFPPPSSSLIVNLIYGFLVITQNVRVSFHIGYFPAYYFTEVCFLTLPTSTITQGSILLNQSWSVSIIAFQTVIFSTCAFTGLKTIIKAHSPAGFPLLQMSTLNLWGTFGKGNMGVRSMFPTPISYLSDPSESQHVAFKLNSLLFIQKSNSWFQTALSPASLCARVALTMVPMVIQQRGSIAPTKSRSLRNLPEQTCTERMPLLDIIDNKCHQNISGGLNGSYYKSGT